MMTDKQLTADEIQSRIVEVRKMRFGDVAANPRNPKRHPANQRAALRGSVRELGFGTVPIAYTSQRLGGKIAWGDGHLRGDEFADYVGDVAVTDYTDEEIDKFLLYADPIAAMAEHDATLLDALLQSVNTGDAALQEMLAGLAASAGLYLDKKEIEDPGPQIDKADAKKYAAEYGTATGQLWELGRHKIACKSCGDIEAIKSIVGDECQAIWADPPYGIEAVKNGKVFNNKTLAVRSLTDNPVYAPIIGDATTETATKTAALYLDLFPKAIHFWWGANHYANSLPPSPCWIIWDKETGDGFFADAELAWSNQGTSIRIFRHQWKGLIKDSERGERRVHPTQKPVALAHWCFEKYGKAGDVIVDPFLGSGISVLAAEQLGDNRRVIGFELAPEYIAVTIHRWEMLTGQKAKLLTL